jgi:PAS domain S-box-containing protein
MDGALNQSMSLSTRNIEEAHWRFAEMMPYAVFVTLNGGNIYCNESGSRLIGLSDPIEMKGRCIKEFVHPDFLEAFEKITITPIEKGKVCPIIETKFVKLDGTIIDVEIASSPFSYKENYGIYLIVRDITSSNKIKKSLEESEERYRTLVEMLPDAICLRGKDRLLYANMAAAKTLGCEKPEEVVGRDITDFIAPYPANELDISDYDNELMVRGYIPFREDCYIRKADGEIMPRETAIKLIPNGEEPVYLVISRDISERKHTEELKKKVEEKAKELDEAVEYDKLRTEFFTNISHEFRTPLNVMLSALQLSCIVLNDSPTIEGRDNVKKYMNLMKQNCYRLIRLVNNLIDITRIDTGYYKISPEECNIVSIIEDITLSVKNYIENKGISITFDTDAEEIMMVCDPDKIERIMLNLLSNALKFTDSPGHIMVNVSDKNDKVFISVKDTGIGVPEGKEKLIFDRFQQVDKSLSRNHEGSGIGLALVKSLVEMHGGNIKLNSIYNEGSEFIIELPMNNYLDKKPINKKSPVNQSKLERINVEFSDIYF